jgi:hypothetical protein
MLSKKKKSAYVNEQGEKFQTAVRLVQKIFFLEPYGLSGVFYSLAANRAEGIVGKNTEWG